MSQNPIRRISRRQMLGASFGIAASASLLAACGSSQTSAPASQSGTHAKELRLGFQPPYIPVFALQEQNFLHEALGGQNLAVDYRSMLSPTPIIEAIVGRSLDFGIGGNPVAPLASGQPLTVVAITERSPRTHAILVPADSPIQTPADLRGKKLATPPSSGYIFPHRVLAKYGLSAKDLEIIKVENNEGRSALVTGAIDAWATWDPFYAVTELEEDVRVLVDGENYHQNYVVLYAHDEYVAQYPDTVRAFIRSYAQATNWIHANRKAALDLLVTHNQLSPAAAELTFNRRNYAVQAPDQVYFDSSAQDSAQLQEFGVIQQIPDWQAKVNVGLAQEALTDL
jgi:sulfonate transport system substrate-binding protein